MNNISIKLTEENELAFITETEDGINYIIIDSDGVSFVFISNIPGQYKTLHLGKDGVTTKDILNAFIK